MIRKLIPTDVSGLNNITPVEWDFDYESFLEEFMACDFFHAFVMIDEGIIIGTGNLLISDKVAWLANIIIKKNCRGRGLGLKMSQFLVDFATDQGCETQLLLATDLGKAVYQKIGFREITIYHRFRSVLDQGYSHSDNIRKLQLADKEQVYELDRLINGENRTHLLDKYYSSGLGCFNSGNELIGFYLPNFGRGLILSSDARVGLDLLRFKHSKKGMITMLPADNQRALEFFSGEEFKKGESITRMVRGKDLDWRPTKIYSYASGYCG